jgi:hypothetical protein
MKVQLAPGATFAVASAMGALASCFTRPLLGISFLVTAAGALALNGARGTLASIRIRPVDADDPTSPAAIARTIRRIMAADLVFLAAIAIGHAVAAIRTDEGTTQVLAATVSAAAVCAGPLTSVRRRAALWAAAGVVLVGLSIWWSRVATA